MTSFIVSIVAKVLDLLPNADNTTTLYTAIASSFTYFNGTIAKINVFFPVYTLFQVLGLIVVIEIIIFLVSMIFKLRSLI